MLCVPAKVRGTKKKRKKVSFCQTQHRNKPTQFVSVVVVVVSLLFSMRESCDFRPVIIDAVIIERDDEFLVFSPFSDWCFGYRHNWPSKVSSHCHSFCLQSTEEIPSQRTYTIRHAFNVVPFRFEKFHRRQMKNNQTNKKKTRCNTSLR